jgi:hypothetical protein
MKNPECVVTNTESAIRCDRSPDGQPLEEDNSTSEVNQTARIIEVKLPNGEVNRYEDHSVLREEIINGTMRRDFRARVITKSDAEEKEVEWSTLEKVVDTSFELQLLYKPVWAHTMKGAVYGALVGILLKALDTTVTLFAIDATAGVVWLLVVGSLFAKRWWAPAIAIFVAVKLGIQSNLFITALAVAVVGSVFGAPAGMLIGTIVGICRKRKIPMANDADAEGKRTYVYGLVFPTFFLATMIPLYVFWLIPKMIQWVS